MEDRTVNMLVSSMHVLVDMRYRTFKAFRSCCHVGATSEMHNVPTCNEIKALFELPRYLLVIMANQCKSLYFTRR